MALKATNPTTTNAWSKLQSHFETLKSKHLKELFSEDQNRAKDLTVKWEDFYADFSKNRITKETIELLTQLANEVDLKDAISKYFNGEVINETEGRAVAHTALRAPKNTEVFVEGVNIIPGIHDVKEKIKNFTAQVVGGV
ncbi:glucose-6-phosphate isomerase, partial [Winogradskyella sp.]|nr:glucose-6-phosphate isomerase [Winogradskyella sp.]